MGCTWTHVCTVRDNHHNGGRADCVNPTDVASGLGPSVHGAAGCFQTQIQAPRYLTGSGVPKGFLIIVAVRVKEAKKEGKSVKIFQNKSLQTATYQVNVCISLWQCFKLKHTDYSNTEYLNTCRNKLYFEYNLYSNSAYAFVIFFTAHFYWASHKLRRHALHRCQPKILQAQ